MITWLVRSRTLFSRSSLSSRGLSHVPQQPGGNVACWPSIVPRHKQCVTSISHNSTRAFSTITSISMSDIVDKISNLVVGNQSAKMDSNDEVFVGSIDQGTTSSRFLIFNKAGEPVAEHQEEFKQIYPNPG